MPGDDWYRTHIRSRHATNARAVAVANAIGFLVVLAFLAAVAPLLWGQLWGQP